MLHRFMALVVDPWSSHSRQSAARIEQLLAERCPHLRRVWSQAGFSFFLSEPEQAASKLTALSDNTGFLFGTIFSRHAEPMEDRPMCRPAFDCSSVKRIAQRGASELVNAYWGHYLAFLLQSDGRVHQVFRSPACTQSALYVHWNGVQIYFSRLEDLAALGIIALNVNWDYLAIYCGSGRVQCAETGLKEVRELQIGELHEIGSQTLRTRFPWSPVEIAQRPPLADRGSARRALRSAIRSCIGSWASEHEIIVQRLSGGVDSSVVAACLVDAPRRPQVTGVNYFAPGAYGDERKYARAVARKLGIELVEYRQAGDFSLHALMSYPQSESPFSYLFKVECDAREIALAREVRASARMTGTMGDILFQVPPAAATVTEYLQRCGIDRRLFSLALDAAQVDRVSIWKLLKNAFLNARWRPPQTFTPGEYESLDATLLSNEARSAFSASERFVHPWLHNVLGVPFGKLTLVSCLGFNSTFYNSLHEQGESELLHPLLSEPVVETCLRIPSYDLLFDGWDRALVREAFAAELPAEVQSRRTKGSMNRWLREMLSTNASYIKELLLDGTLVQQGILDRDLVERALPGRTHRGDVPMGTVLDCVAAESWCQVRRSAHVQQAVA